MGAYADSVLAEGEKVVYSASISRWKYLGSYLFGTLLIVGGLVAIFFTYFGTDFATKMFGAVPLVLGLVIIFVAIIRRRTTELVLTDRRIIAKRGFVSRETVEMNLSKVESIHVSQGLAGRMLNYGDVAVVGTGASLEPLRGVSRPLELRRKLGELADVPVLQRSPERNAVHRPAAT
jgi:uncharacterized membrane protein YdbT with pleckstrin-like domain